jgi:hypothetical protein
MNGRTKRRPRLELLVSEKNILDLRYWPTPGLSDRARVLGLVVAITLKGSSAE